MIVLAALGQLVAMVAGLALGGFVLDRILGAAVAWAAGWKARAETMRSDLARAQSNAEHFRARWEAAAKDRDRNALEVTVMTQAFSRAASALSDARAAKAVLRRRLRGVLWQARAWKAEAVALGWSDGLTRSARRMSKDNGARRWARIGKVKR